MTGRDDFRSTRTPVSGSNTGLSEDASPYASEVQSITTLDEAKLQALTDACSTTVKAAIDAHLDAGLTVYGRDGAKTTSGQRPTPK
jgi:hypothetical protein